MSPESLIQLSDRLKSLYKKKEKLKGSDRRQFMAEVVKSLALGGQTVFGAGTGVESTTIRKGMQELENGMSIADWFKLRGRKPVEQKRTNLLPPLATQTPGNMRMLMVYLPNCHYVCFSVTTQGFGVSMITTTVLAIVA